MSVFAVISSHEEAVIHLRHLRPSTGTRQSHSQTLARLSLYVTGDFCDGVHVLEFNDLQDCGSRNILLYDAFVPVHITLVSVGVLVLQ